MDRKKQLKLLYRIKSRISCSWDDLMRLSIEQLNYINQRLGENSFLEACPGSGKTEVIGIKAALTIATWKNVYSGIAVLTFTTSAAKELNNRVRKYGAAPTDTFPHYIGTFDSWIHGYIVQPFAHYRTKFQGRDGDKSYNLIDIESSAPFLIHYQTLITSHGKSIPLKITEFSLDSELNPLGLSDLARSLIAASTTVEHKNLIDNKIKFFQAGFATYADFEFLAYRLLTKHPFLATQIARRFGVLIVDECQDLSPEQLRILKILSDAGCKLHFVGDLNQSIYEFRNVDPSRILAFIKENLPKKLTLTNNYRSSQSIVNICQKLIHSSSSILGLQTSVIEKSCYLWEYHDDNFELLPKRFEDFVIKNGIKPANSAILARGKATLSLLRTQEDKHSFSKIELFALAIHNWNKSSRQTDDLRNALFYSGRAFSLFAYEGKGDTRNQYCPYDIDVVDWRLFLQGFLNSASRLCNFHNDGVSTNWRSWAADLRQFLGEIWITLPGKAMKWEDATHSVRAPKGRGDEAVRTICSSLRAPNNLRTTTIHSVKGETLDAVLLVSHHTRQSPGGHFSHWITEGDVSEHVRFAYVACSRPKFLLVIVTPKLGKSDLSKFSALGLTPE